jgi:ssRNA-specific RNase YbeY (16S rRNA maturation enzyme)
MVFLGGGGGSALRRKHIAAILERIAPHVVSDDVLVEVSIVSGPEHQYTVHSYEWPKDFPKPDASARPLGEIYLNPRFIAAHNQQFDHLLIHGFLHLVGYDHVHEDDRIRMEALEAVLLRLW